MHNYSLEQIKVIIWGALAANPPAMGVARQLVEYGYIERDDIIGIVYEKAVRNYDPSKSSFSTHLGNVLFPALHNVLTTEHRVKRNKGKRPENLSDDCIDELEDTTAEKPFSGLEKMLPTILNIYSSLDPLAQHMFDYCIITGYGVTDAAKELRVDPYEATKAYKRVIHSFKRHHETGKLPELVKNDPNIIDFLTAKKSSHQLAA